MDTRFTDEELAFQAEVRDFFSNVMDDSLQALLDGAEASANLKEGMIEYQRRLNARGWMAPGWPVEYGGQDWSVTQHFIFNAERGKAGAPAPIAFGVTMVAPVIYTYGTDEQKARFLPRILNSDDWWCQGYSEPGAGSDLASLQCKAERDGDDYVINGSKCWITSGQLAHVAIVWAKLDGVVKAFLVPTDTPGFSADAISQLRRAFKILYRQGLTIDIALQRLELMLRDTPEIQVLIDSIRASERGIVR